MSDLWTGRLSEWLDGTLEPAERAECERHLETCAECALTLESLRAVVTRARALPGREPGEDLWPAIEARIRAGSPARSLRLPGWGVRFSFSLPQAAAAALLLVALSGGATWWLLRGVLRAPGQPPGAARRAATGAGGAPAARAPEAELTGFDRAHYDTAIADLEGALREHRAELDSSTVRVLEQNLSTIDRAIAQARSALATDPASPYLNRHLARQMLLKIDLLRRATTFRTANG